MNGEQNTTEEKKLAEGQEGGSESAPFLVKTFAVVGFVAIVVLAAWMSVQVIRYTPSALSTAAVSLSSLFTGGSRDAVVIDLPSRVVDAGSDFSIPLGGPVSDGGYSFSYECVEGVAISVRTPEELRAVPCTESYRFASSPLTIVAASAEARYVDVNVTIAAKTPQGEDAGSAAVMLTIVNPEAAGGEAPEEPSSAPVPASGSAPVAAPAPVPVTREVPVPASDPNGTPDLKVSITEVGIVTTKSGKDVFTKASVIDADERAYVRFTVENTGTKTAASDWTFTAQLPIEGDRNYEYESKEQPSLRPGDKIEFTLSFDDIVKDDEGVITVTVEPEDRADRASNDTARRTIKIRD